VVKDADGVGDVEGVVGKGQGEDVGLHQVRGGPGAQVQGRGVDGAGEVHAHHLGAPARHDLRVAPGAHAGIEHQPPADIPRAEAGLEREAVLGLAGAVGGVDLHGSESMPLVAEALGVGVVGDEARDPADDRVAGVATRAGQSPGHDLAVADRVRPKREVALAGGAREELAESGLHDTRIS
jgi:hypothetical protein